MFTTFKAGKVPLFVEGSAFHDPWHYGKLMGYDKYVSTFYARDCSYCILSAQAD